MNAKYHEREAHIIAQAGRYKAVTIATNMAGRGTDIMLGGNAEHLAKSLAEEKLEDKNDHAQRDELTRKFIEQFRQQVKEEHEKVVAAGGCTSWAPSAMSRGVSITSCAAARAARVIRVRHDFMFPLKMT